MPRARSQDFKLENMRGMFLHLLKPQKREENGVVKLSYNGSFLWPKSQPTLVGKTMDGKDLDVMAEAAKVATEEWGDKAVEWIKAGAIKNPFLDGDGPQAVNKKTGERHAGFAGHRFIRAASNADHPPGVFNSNAGADGKLVKIVEPAACYSGAYYHVVVNLYAWEHAQNGKGLSFGLNMVQFAREGEKVGGGPADPNTFFAPIGASIGQPAASVGDTSKGAGGLFA